MRPQHSNFICAIMTAAAAAAFPISAGAQEPTKAPFQPASAYLDQAGGVLNSVPEKAPHGGTKTLSELRKHFDELTKAYTAQKDQVGPPLTREDPGKDAPTWRDNFSDVERDLVVLIGGGSSLAPSAVRGSEVVAPNPTAASSVPASTIGASSPSPVGTTGTIPATPPTSVTSVPSPVDTGVTSASAPGSNGATTTNTMPSSPVTSPSGTPATSAAPSDASAPNTPPSGAAAPNPAPTAATTPNAAPSAPAGGSTSAAAAGGTLAMADSLAASKVSVTGLQDLDPGVRSQLEQFRLQLELFYSATIGSLR